MKKLLACLAVFALMTSYGTVHGSIYSEGPGDAGLTLGTAQILPELGGGDSIVGFISVAGDVDLFRFSWQGGILDINTLGPGGAGELVDSQLHLFDSTGAGIAENDDSVDGGGTTRSQIHLSLAAGVYYLGISAFDIDAIDVADAMIFGGYGNDDTDLSGNTLQRPDVPAGVLDDWAGVTGSGSTGTYSIGFFGAPVSVVPEPTTMAIWLCLGGIVVLGRRRK